MIHQKEHLEYVPFHAKGMHMLFFGERKGENEIEDERCLHVISFLADFSARRPYSQGKLKQIYAFLHDSTACLSFS